MKRKAQSAKRKTIVRKLLSFTLLALTFTPYPSPIYAASPSPCPSPPYPSGVPIGDCFGFGGITSLGQGVNQLIMPVFSIATTLVVIYFLIGAFKYLTAGGNKEAVEGARQMITHAIIGFIILMFAFFMMQYIPQFFNLPGLDIIR